MAQSLKVSSKSVPHSVAGALAGILRERPTCEMQVIGAGALNQGIKAIAIARTYLSEDGLDLSCVPEFTEVEIDGQARTAIRIVVERRATGRRAAAAPSPEVAVADVRTPAGVDIDLAERERSRLGARGREPFGEPEPKLPGGLFGDRARERSDTEP